MSLKIEWRDSGREPRCAPDPAYPTGKDVDLTALSGTGKTCTATLPYPAKRCGAFIIECSVCGMRIAVTTAGRPDDPRSVRMPCKETRQ